MIKLNLRSQKTQVLPFISMSLTFTNTIQESKSYLQKPHGLNVGEDFFLYTPFVTVTQLYVL